jgi:hypothetical protein
MGTTKSNVERMVRHAVILAVLIAGILASACSKTWESGGTTVTLSRDGTLRVSPHGAAVKTFGGGTQSDVMTFGGRMFDNGNERTWRGDSASITALIIDDGVTHVGSGAFEGLVALKSVVIPNTVRVIADEAFAGCVGLTSVAIPGSVELIGDEAFANCVGLTSVTIPGSVESIGKSAFYNCRGLTSITIQNGVKSIGDNAFDAGKSLAVITIPGSVKSIGESAFRCNCPNVKSLTIPEGVVSIGKSAFSRLTNLTSIIIPSSVVSIGAGAFAGSSDSLTSIDVHKGNPAYVSVGGVLFNKAQDTLMQYPGAKQGDAYTIPNSVKTIGEYAFSNAGLTSIIIPNSVTTIGLGAFGTCAGLTSVIIPKSVTIIGDWAFANCRSLTSVTSLNPVPPRIRQDFNEVSHVFIIYDEDGRFAPKTDTLYVPKTSITAYKQASGWKNFKEILPVKK